MKRGERNPSLDVVWRLARALDVDSVELIGDELTRLNRADLLQRAQNEMSRKSNEEIRAWLRMARVAPR